MWCALHQVGVRHSLMRDDVESVPIREEIEQIEDIDRAAGIEISVIDRRAAVAIDKPQPASAAGSTRRILNTSAPSDDMSGPPAVNVAAAARDCNENSCRT